MLDCFLLCLSKRIHAAAPVWLHTESYGAEVQAIYIKAYFCRTLHHLELALPPDQTLPSQWFLTLPTLPRFTEWNQMFVERSNLYNHAQQIGGVAFVEELLC